MDVRNLILEAKKGNNEAFGKIYQEYFTPIYRFLYFRLADKNTVEDLTQEVFVKAFQSISAITISDKNPLTYFYTIARNLLIDNYRKKKIPNIDDEEAENLLIEEDNPERQAIIKEDIKTLKKALALVSSDEADALVLKFIDNYSNTEISKIMGKSEEAVRQLHSRGLRSLRKFISKNDFI